MGIKQKNQCLPVLTVVEAQSNNQPTKEDAQLIAAAPKMLEDLINIMLYWETGKPIYKSTFADTIRKATGKSWEEIKRMII